jgi:hypothetical protein
MIVNLRGCNGSGKTTIVRNLLAIGNPQELFGVYGIARPEAYKLTLKNIKKPLYILGPYTTPTGGCDRLFPATVLELVLKYKKQGHVLFEGLIISDHYGTLMKTLEPMGRQVIVAFLTTSFEVCYERTAARSGAALKTTPKADYPWVKRLVGEHANGSLVSYHFASIARVRENMIDGPIYGGIFRVEDISSDTGHDKILGWLK